MRIVTFHRDMTVEAVEVVSFHVPDDFVFDVFTFDDTRYEAADYDRIDDRVIKAGNWVES